MAALTSPFVVGLVSRVVVQVVAFAQIIVAARYLDLTGFGTYALAWAITVISISFVYTGFYQALLRSEDYARDRDTAFAAMASIGLGGAMVLLAIGGAVHISGGTHAAVFVWLAVLPAARVLIAWNEVVLVRRKSVRLVSIGPAISESVALAVTWASFHAGLGLYALVVGRFVVLLIEAAIILGSVRAIPGLSVSRQSFRSLRASAFPLWGTSALGMFSIYGADLVLGAFLSPAAVGAYRAGARVSQTASDLVAQPLTLLSWSRFTHLKREGKDHAIRQAWLDHMGLSAALLWPILTTVCLLAEPLIVVVFDPAWLPAVSIMVILAVSRGVRFVSALLEPTLTSLDRGADQLRVRLVGGVVLLAGLLAFGRLSGDHAAYAHLLASVVVAIYAIHVLRRALKLQFGDLARCFGPGLMLSGATAAVVLTADRVIGTPGSAPDLVLTLALWIMLCAPILAGLAWLRIVRLPTP